MCLVHESQRHCISGLNIFVIPDPRGRHPESVISYDSMRYAARGVNYWDYNCFLFQHWATSGGGIFDYGFVKTIQGGGEAAINWVATRPR